MCTAWDPFATEWIRYPDCARERKAVYARFDGAAKAELWTLHLAEFVAAHPELTDQQRAVIAEGRELLTSGVLQALKSESSGEAEDARNAMLAFEAKARRLFSRELYSAAFVRLGPPTKSATVLRVNSLRPECYCNPNYDECFGGECYTGGCWVMPDGCGTFGGDICTRDVLTVFETLERWVRPIRSTSSSAVGPAAEVPLVEEVLTRSCNSIA